jgi:predicted transcriptional regulator
MRKSGLSNHDIAKTLGIGIATVRRYIGSQGGRIENLEALKDPAKRKTLAVNDADVARQELKKVDADLIKETYESKSNIAEIHYKDKNVFINNALSFETFDDFMILRHL